MIINLNRKGNKDKLELSRVLNLPSLPLLEEQGCLYLFTPRTAYHCALISPDT
ncbi:hypothetical protein FACS189441_6800 [Betaproteobacteria bacterium]|nr:hypothetical protein FACS189441_6800 [Betaproteobacteria bacterium]